jgi:hypothetical protein
MSYSFAYNNGSSPSGTTKFAKLQIGGNNREYTTYGGLNWYASAPYNGKFLIVSDTYSQGWTNQETATPTFWRSAENSLDSLKDLVNQLPDVNGVTGYTTVGDAINYINSSDKYLISQESDSYPEGDIVLSGLVLSLDVGYSNSYPKSGTTWYDIKGTNNGTLTNGPTFSTDGGGSIVFDGSDDYGTITSTGAYGNNSFSITVVVYPEFDNIQYGRPIFTKTDSCGSTLEFGIEYNRNNVPSGQPNKFSVLIGGNLAMESSSQYLKNNWYIVTSNYNSSDGSYSLYVNGELSASGTTGFDVGGGNGNWGIGRWDGCYPSVPPWLGKISVILFYNKSLNNIQSIQNYNALKGRFEL